MTDCHVFIFQTILLPAKTDHSNTTLYWLKKEVWILWFCNSVVGFIPNTALNIEVTCSAWPFLLLLSSFLQEMWGSLSQMEQKHSSFERIVWLSASEYDCNSPISSIFEVGHNQYWSLSSPWHTDSRPLQSLQPAVGGTRSTWYTLYPQKHPPSDFLSVCCLHRLYREHRPSGHCSGPSCRRRQCDSEVCGRW